MHFKHINMRMWLIASLAAPALLAAAQPAGDSIPAPKNELNIDLQFLGRGETRYGGLPAVPIEVDEDYEIIDPDNVPTSNFLLSRTRLPINYKRDWLEVRVTPQHSGVWGQAGKGAFNLHESWVKMTTRQGLFAQLGRVALSYDDERIIGTDDWAMTSPSHDILRLGYEGHGHKVHVILAYNQNAEVINSGGSLYWNGAQPYKTMNVGWYHYDFQRIPLGASLLFMNIGMQNDISNTPDFEKTWFQHLLGTYLTFHPERWVAEASYYRQFGRNENGVKIDAWMASGKLTYKLAENCSLTAGYDHLSGDKYFAVPTGHNLGMVHHDVIKGFSSVYGSHHQFYGAMDFFYVSAYHDGFTPGLRNAYIGATYSPFKNFVCNASYHYLATATELDDMNVTLGHEVELQAGYALSRDVKLSLGASFMRGSETMKRLKRSTTKNDLRWGWVSVSVTPRIFSTKW
jgi:hypothetical protein